MDRNKVIVKTSILGIFMNIMLVIFKMLVGFFANSISIILDAVNNLTDILSSIVTIVGTKLSTKAPDKEHPYGHGRIEYFTSVIISIIILLAGVSAIKESVRKIINPATTEYSIVSFVIILGAVFTKFIFSKYAKKTGASVNSQTLIATGQDALMDSILSFSTLVGAIINYIWHLKLEGYIGILIGVFILKSSIDIFKDSVESLKKIAYLGALLAR